MSSVGSTIMPEPIVPPYYGGDDVTSAVRYVVRNANLSLQVKNVSQAVDESSKYVESIGGLVINSSVSKTDEGYVGYLTLRVPEKDFTTAMQYFKRLAKTVTEEQVSAYDETSQVTSVEDQLAELNTQLIRYQGLLNGAQTTEEKLNIQNQSDQLQRQISYLQRQEQSLKGQVKMGQINLTYSEEKFSLPILGNLGLNQVINEATQALKRVALLIVVLAIWVVIFTPIWLPTVLIIRWIKRK